MARLSVCVDASVAVQIVTREDHSRQADALWTDWIGGNPDHWPMRSCVQVTFTGGNRIELLATAVRDEP